MDTFDDGTISYSELGRGKYLADPPGRLRVAGVGVGGHHPGVHVQSDRGVRELWNAPARSRPLAGPIPAAVGNLPGDETDRRSRCPTRIEAPKCSTQALHKRFRALGGRRAGVDRPNLHSSKRSCNRCSRWFHASPRRRQRLYWRGYGRGSEISAAAYDVVGVQAALPGTRRRSSRWRRSRFRT